MLSDEFYVALQTIRKSKRYMKVSFMNHVHCFVVLLLFTLTMSSKSYSRNEALVLEGPYLGQEPPSLIPELFAPGTVPTKNLEIEGVFAPGMKEFYFTRQVLGDIDGVVGDVNTHAIQYRNGVWHQSVPELRLGEISISPECRWGAHNAQHSTSMPLRGVRPVEDVYDD